MRPYGKRLSVGLERNEIIKNNQNSIDRAVGTLWVNFDFTYPEFRFAVFRAVIDCAFGTIVRQK